jgi:hypothetical protein
MSKQQQEKATANVDAVQKSISLQAPVIPAMPVATPEMRKLNYRFLFKFYHDSEQVKVSIPCKVQSHDEIMAAHGGQDAFTAAYDAVKDEMIQPRLKKALDAKYAGKATLKDDAERLAFTTELATFCQAFCEGFTLDIPADYLIALERKRQAKMMDAALSLMSEEQREAFRKMIAGQ